MLLAPLLELPDCTTLGDCAILFDKLEGEVDGRLALLLTDPLLLLPPLPPLPGVGVLPPLPPLPPLPGVGVIVVVTVVIIPLVKVTVFVETNGLTGILPDGVLELMVTVSLLGLLPVRVIVVVPVRV